MHLYWTLPRLGISIESVFSHVLVFGFHYSMVDFDCWRQPLSARLAIRSHELIVLLLSASAFSFPRSIYISVDCFLIVHCFLFFFEFVTLTYRRAYFFHRPTSHYLCLAFQKICGWDVRFYGSTECIPPLCDSTSLLFSGDFSHRLELVGSLIGESVTG